MAYFAGGSALLGEDGLVFDYDEDYHESVTWKDGVVSMGSLTAWKQSGQANTYTHAGSDAIATRLLDSMYTIEAISANATNVADSDWESTVLEIRASSDPSTVLVDLYFWDGPTLNYWSALRWSKDAGLIWNADNFDWDFIIRGVTEDKVVWLDASTDTLFLGGTSARTTFYKDGDVWFEGAGAGWPFGSFWTSADFTQSSMTSNTWYPITLAAISDGQLNHMTHDGSGKLTMQVAGKYMLNYSVTVTVNTAGRHVQSGIRINGSVSSEEGVAHYDPQGVGVEGQLSGNVILSLSVGDEVELAVRTTDSGTGLTVTIDHISCNMVQIGS
jgi:hypothetical protein